MSNAHRPTFFPAKGGGTATTTEGGYFHGGSRGAARSAKDQPGHKSLKFRVAGQSSLSDVAARDLQRELETKERENFERLRRERERRDGGSTSGNASARPALLTDAPAATRSDVRSTGVAPGLAAFDDADDDAVFAEVRGGSGDGEQNPNEADDDDDVEDDDDEDDSAELLRELERIRHEREEERARKEKELAELATKETTEAVLRGNPLLTKGASGTLGAAGATAYGGGSAAIKRRFGDDTVFSHTHATEPDAKRRFINDSIRSDFHRSFMRCVTLLMMYTTRSMRHAQIVRTAEIIHADVLLSPRSRHAGASFTRHFHITVTQYQ